MSNPFTKVIDKIVYQVQEMFNMSFDNDFNQNTFEELGYDGQQLQRKLADNLAVKLTVIGSVTYIGLAAPGTLQSAASWQAQKIDTTSGIVVTWADSGNFSQIATDLTTLTYS